MANTLCYLPHTAIHKPGTISNYGACRNVNWINHVSTDNFKGAAAATNGFEALKALGKNPSTKPNSILCDVCEGSGAKKCGQCEGNGVNLVDHFYGQFKAGASCWLCSGKKLVLCGNCNGAGFIGGFMSTYDQ